MLWIVWLVTLTLLGAWTLLAWGTHALLTLDPAHVGKLEPLIAKIPYGEAIERWIPNWQEWLRLSLEATQAMLGWVGGAAPLIVGVLWGIGALLLLAFGGVLTLIVRLARRPNARTSA